MTGDLGPGETGPSDVSAAFDAYVLPAAGLADERGDVDVAALLNDVEAVEAVFVESSVTHAGGESFALVDVTLRSPRDASEGATSNVRHRIVDLLNEVVAADGYRVREVRVRGPEPCPLGGGDEK